MAFYYSGTESTDKTIEEINKVAVENNLLQKDDRLMIKNVIISSALHLFLVVITALTFPFIAKKPIDLPPLISIELIS